MLTTVTTITTMKHWARVKYGLCKKSRKFYTKTTPKMKFPKIPCKNMVIVGSYPVQIPGIKTTRTAAGSAETAIFGAFMGGCCLSYLKRKTPENGRFMRSCENGERKTPPGSSAGCIAYDLV